MGTNNYIISNGSTSDNSTPNTQPLAAGFWNNGGVLTWFDGVNNNPVDFSHGGVTDAFGVDTGIDI